MARYKATLFSSETNVEEIGIFDKEEDAINACIEWGRDEDEIDNNEEEEEARNGLKQRGYCCLGYSSYQLYIEEIV